MFACNLHDCKNVKYEFATTLSKIIPSRNTACLSVTPHLVIIACFVRFPEQSANALVDTFYQAPTFTSETDLSVHTCCSVICCFKHIDRPCTSENNRCDKRILICFGQCTICKLCHQINTCQLIYTQYKICLCLLMFCGYMFSVHFLAKVSWNTSEHH